MQAKRGPTPEQVVAEQKRRAAKGAAREPSTAVAKQPIAPTPAVVAADNRTPEQRYVDEIAPTSFPGTLIKFSKEGAFVTTSDGEEVDIERDFVALCDETLIGWIKFSGEDGVPPERVQGLLYDGFILPGRSTLGDDDPNAWPIGISGTPTDPWLHQIALVLEDRTTHDLFTFATTSATGRRACGNLLRSYDRLRRSHPDCYPVVKLKSGGFHHKDSRVGFVHTPVFAVVGCAPKASAAIPDASVAADMNDQIPF